MTVIRQAILDELTDDEELLFFEPEALDAAIIGLSCYQPARPSCVVYDYHTLVDVYVREGMTEEDAIEWIGVNTLGSWLGDTTPIVVETLDLTNI